MHRKPPAVHVVGFFAQQVKHLRQGQSNQKIEGRIGVSGDEEQGRFLVAQRIKAQFVVGHARIVQVVPAQRSSVMGARQQNVIFCIVGQFHHVHRGA